MPVLKNQLKLGKKPVGDASVRAQAKEENLSRARVANAEAFVKHISERIQSKMSSFGGLDEQNLTSRTASSRHTIRKSYITDTGSIVNEPVAAVSEYLQKLVRDLVIQMTAPSSSRHHYRHVLLIDEVLRRDAIFGFTPTMIMAGVADIIYLLAQALLEGNFLVPPSETPTTGAAKRSSSHRAAIARAVSMSAQGALLEGPSSFVGTRDTRSAGLSPLNLAAPQVGIDTYLPSHIKRSECFDGLNDVGPIRESAALDAVIGGEPVDGHEDSLAHQTRDTEAAVITHSPDETDLTDDYSVPFYDTLPEHALRTIQEALYYLIQRTAQPLICITLEDQRLLVPAVELLSRVLSRISSEVISDGAIEYPVSATPSNLNSPVLLDRGSSGSSRHGHSVEGVRKGAAGFESSSSRDQKGIVSGGGNSNSSGEAAENTGLLGPGGRLASLIEVPRQPTHLGGLTMEQHENITKEIRLAALAAIEAQLSIYEEHLDALALLNEAECVMKKGPQNGPLSATMQKEKASLWHIDTMSDFAAKNLQLHHSETASMLVERWMAILLKSVPLTGWSNAREGDRVTPVLDSARNVNAFNAEHAFQCDGRESDEESSFSRDGEQAGQADVLSLSSEEEGDLPSKNSVHSARERLAKNATPPVAEIQVDSTEWLNKDDSRLRGVLSQAEEREIAAILHIFIQMCTLSEHAAETIFAREKTKIPMGYKEEAIMPPILEGHLHPQVPILLSKTLARCAVGDYCSSLCLDLLWQISALAPEMTSRSVLYHESNAARSKQRTANSLIDTSAAENFFQTLTNFLNASHRNQQREMRNDLVVFLSSILRVNTKALEQVPLDEEAMLSQVQLPVPICTIDAMSAISLVVFDLLCRPELMENGQMSKNTSGRLYSRFGFSDPNGAHFSPNSTCLSFVTQQTVLPYHLRFHGVECSTLRAENLQFKRIGWGFLAAFIEWQAIHQKYEEKLLQLLRMEGPQQRVTSALKSEWDNRTPSNSAAGQNSDRVSLHPTDCDEAEAIGSQSQPSVNELVQIRHETLESFSQLDLLHTGFLDVLLMYTNMDTSNTAILFWSVEDRTVLQEEAWRLINAIVSSAEYLRQLYELGSVCEDDIDIIRSRLHCQNALLNPDACLHSSTLMPPPSPNTAFHFPPSVPIEGVHFQSPKLQAHYPADVYFIALEGIEKCLNYLYKTPSGAESLRYLIITLLSSVSRSTDRNVQRCLAESSPALVPLLHDLLQTILFNVSHSLAPSKARHTSRRMPSPAEPQTWSTIPPGKSLKTLLLSSFSLLYYMGAAEEALGHAPTTDPSTSLPSPIMKPFSTSLGIRPLSAESQSFNQVPAKQGKNIASPRMHFFECGGIELLVGWLDSILSPNPLRTESFYIAALSQMNLGTPPLKPPIVESDLFENLDVVLVLLNCIRLLVLPSPPALQELVRMDGLKGLLSLVEVLSIASGSLPIAFGKTSPHLLSERSVTQSLPNPLYEQSLNDERQAAFVNALNYALLVLSDVLQACPAASAAFFEWHCSYLHKPHEVGFGAPHHPQPRANFLNATQLLLALWEKVITERPPTDPFYMSNEEDNLSLPLGLQLLKINIRPLTVTSLRREYVRRLLRCRVQERMESAKDKGAEPSIENCVSMQELVSYFNYIFETDLNPASEEEASLRMLELVKTDDEQARIIHEQLVREKLHQALGVGSKVFSCFSAIGFEKFVDVPISPGDRSHLISIAAIPALFSDELITGMAEVSQARDELEWNTQAKVDLEKSYLDTPPLDLNKAVPLRPTTPDRRCLCSVMDSIQERNHELAQLLSIGNMNEATQLRELFNRFLITRLKQPTGVASLWDDYNTKHGTCSTCAFDVVDSSAKRPQLQPTDLTAPDESLEIPKSMPIPQDPDRELVSPAPIDLAASVMLKAVQEQEAEATRACNTSYPDSLSFYRALEEKLLSEGVDAGQLAELVAQAKKNEEAAIGDGHVESTPRVLAHHMVQHTYEIYRSQSAEEIHSNDSEVHPSNVHEVSGSKHTIPGHQCPPGCQCSLPHSRRETNKPSSIPSNANATNSSRASHDAAVQQTVESSLVMVWPDRPKSSLAQKHLKRERMIRNSLRAPGGVRLPSIDAHKKERTGSAGNAFARPMAPSDHADKLVSKLLEEEKYTEDSPTYLVALDSEIVSNEVESEDDLYN